MNTNKSQCSNIYQLITELENELKEVTNELKEVVESGNHFHAKIRETRTALKALKAFF